MEEKGHIDPGVYRVQPRQTGTVSRAGGLNWVGGQICVRHLFSGHGDLWVQARSMSESVMVEGGRVARSLYRHVTGSVFICGA